MSHAQLEPTFLWEFPELQLLNFQAKVTEKIHYLGTMKFVFFVNLDSFVLRIYELKSLSIIVRPTACS